VVRPIKIPLRQQTVAISSSSLSSLRAVFCTKTLVCDTRAALYVIALKTFRVRYKTRLLTYVSILCGVYEFRYTPVATCSLSTQLPRRGLLGNRASSTDSLRYPSGTRYPYKTRATTPRRRIFVLISYRAITLTGDTGCLGGSWDSCRCVLGGGYMTRDTLR
jgi:hypothetical protein